MARDPKLGMAMAAGLLGLEQPGSVAGAFALALVMHTLAPWQPPTGAALERAVKSAARFRVSPDLAIFLPREPGWLAPGKKKDAYRALIIALKRMDALQGDERAKAIADVKMLLGAA